MRGAGDTVRATGPVTVATGLPESDTVAVRFDVPATVGMPLTTQPLIVSPAGSVPAVGAQLYGAVPPAAPIVPMYGTPTVAPGKFVRVSVTAPCAG